jgi:adenylylsulfate kinase-like enzyme
MIYWFTGQPGAGKTVLATALKQELDNTFHVDGDDLRAIFDNKDYSETGRRKNIELAQQLAHFLHNKGNNVVVSLVSPYKDQREEFKTKLGESLKEFYVHTTEIRGRENFHVENYQQPAENYLDLDTTNISVEECLQKIRSYAELEQKSTRTILTRI